MNKIKIFIGCLALFAIVAISVNSQDRIWSGLSSDNVDALVKREVSLTGKCNSDEKLCDFFCPNCEKKLGTTTGAKGEPYDLSGNCPNCGHEF